MNNDNDPPDYSLDDYTHELLAEVLNFCEQFADSQLDEESAREIRSTTRALGERLGVEYSTIFVESDTDEEGNPRLTVKTHTINETPTKNGSNVIKLAYDRDRDGGVTDVPTDEVE
tara:strand:+ start:77 stop:424 length:348 start_codon:yes stop_codon:yes gene_type:complete